MHAGPRSPLSDLIRGWGRPDQRSCKPVLAFLRSNTRKTLRGGFHEASSSRPCDHRRSNNALRHDRASLGSCPWDYAASHARERVRRYEPGEHRCQQGSRGADHRTDPAGRRELAPDLWRWGLRRAGRLRAVTSNRMCESGRLAGAAASNVFDRLLRCFRLATPRGHKSLRRRPRRRNVDPAGGGSKRVSRWERPRRHSSDVSLGRRSDDVHAVSLGDLR